jgi:hypothetical protein
MPRSRLRDQPQPHAGPLTPGDLTQQRFKKPIRQRAAVVRTASLRLFVDFFEGNAAKEPRQPGQVSELVAAAGARREVAHESAPVGCRKSADEIHPQVAAQLPACGGPGQGLRPFPGERAVPGSACVHAAGPDRALENRYPTATVPPYAKDQQDPGPLAGKDQSPLDSGRNLDRAVGRRKGRIPLRGRGTRRGHRHHVTRGGPV